MVPSTRFDLSRIAEIGVIAGLELPGLVQLLDGFRRLPVLQQRDAEVVGSKPGQVLVALQLLAAP